MIKESLSKYQEALNKQISNNKKLETLKKIEILNGFSKDPLANFGSFKNFINENKFNYGNSEYYPMIKQSLLKYQEALHNQISNKNHVLTEFDFGKIDPNKLKYLQDEIVIMKGYIDMCEFVVGSIAVEDKGTYLKNLKEQYKELVQKVSIYETNVDAYNQSQTRSLASTTFRQPRDSRFHPTITPTTPTSRDSVINHPTFGTDNNQNPPTQRNALQQPAPSSIRHYFQYNPTTIGTRHRVPDFPPNNSNSNS
jgi:hypothetical protein